MIKKFMVVFLALFLSFTTILNSTYIVFANENIQEAAAPRASKYIDSFSVRIDSSSGGVVQTAATFTTFNVDTAVISGQIQELRNGIWYPVDTFYKSGSSNNITVSNSYNGVKGRTYRADVTFTIYAGSVTEERFLSESTVAK